MADITFSYQNYSVLRVAIAHLLKQALGVVYIDNQLTSAINKLCCYEERDPATAKVDVNMIKKAFKRPGRGSNQTVIQYDAIISSESDLFLHIVDEKDGMKLACSKSPSEGSQFTNAENIYEKSTRCVPAEYEERRDQS